MLVVMLLLLWLVLRIIYTKINKPTRSHFKAVCVFVVEREREREIWKERWGERAREREREKGGGSPPTLGLCIIYSCGFC